MAKTCAKRTRWVSHLRVSTVEQAEKELSLTAQRRSAEEFAPRHDAVIDHHYVEPGASGTDTHRAVFNELLGEALLHALEEVERDDRLVLADEQLGALSHLADVERVPEQPVDGVLVPGPSADLLAVL